MEKLLIIGAGGYAKSVLDSIDVSSYKVEGFLDEIFDKKTHLGKPVLFHSLSEVKKPDEYCYFIAIGNNKHRKAWYDKLVKHNLRVINVIDKSAIVSSGAKLGRGCFVGKMAIVNRGATVGDNCIINSRALVEHGCRVGDHVNISTNTVLNGDISVGTGSFVGSCSVTIGQKSIGEWSTIGAGAVVIDNVPDNVTVVGVPAKVIKKGAMLG